MRKSKKVKIKKSIKKMWATWVNCTVQLHLAIELDPNPSGDCLFMGQKGLCKKKKKKKRFMPFQWKKLCTVTNRNKNKNRMMLT